VLPLLLKSLPLKEDLEENTTVYNCLVPLFSNNRELVRTVSEDTYTLIFSMQSASLSKQWTLIRIRQAGDRVLGKSLYDYFL